MMMVPLAMILASGPVVQQSPAPPVERASTRPRAINIPTATRVTGLESPPIQIDEPRVPGGKALRIQVPSKGDRVWRVNALNTVRQPVAAGSTILLAFWARLERGEDGASSVTLPSNAVREVAPPSSAVMSQPITIDGEWRQYEIKGVTTRDYDANQLVASLHLATGKQTIDISPIFVMVMLPSP